MFLNKLKIRERIAFLELAHHIARCDDDFSNLQKDIIAKYCMEMQIKDVAYDESTFNLDENLSKIKTPQSQKIILLELLILIYSDDYFHPQEKKIVTEITKKFKLNTDLVTVYKNWAKSILAIYAQGVALISL